MPRSPFPPTPLSGVKRSRSSFEAPLARRSLQRILKGRDFLWSPSQFSARDTVTPMGFRTSSKANGFAGAGRASTYQKGQSHRRTEEHGDLNTYNRVFQFYNYHADKDILLDEMCRGLVLSVLRIAGGTVQEYDEPIAWPAPLFPNRADHAHHAALSFHFKDNRRHSTTFGKTLSSFSGRSLTTVANIHGAHLPDQYDAEVYTGALPDIPATWVALHDGTKMYSLKELAAKLAILFSNWIAFTQDISNVDANSNIPKGIDLVPCRMQLIKTTTHPQALQSPYLSRSTVAAHEVEYDDIEFGDSKVDVSAYTSVKLHNVTPASGNVLLKSDPMGSDNITHVPLKGKMYVFSGPVPKVWDKHRFELQHLFKPEFFKVGRYLLPNSRLHSTQTEEFRTPPRGRFIWSNCVDEHSITMAPGGMQELKLNYRVKTSIKDFWYKYRDDDLSSSKLGKSICICLEPSMRRMHINTPIPVVHVKEQLIPIGGTSDKYSGDTRLIPIEYQPYEWKRDATGVTKKQIRQVVTLGILGSQTAIPNTSPPEYSHPGVVPTIPWYKQTVISTGIVVARITEQASATSTLSETTPLMWDEITTAMIIAYPELQSFVSRGDPMMFNVQINRNYGATCSLRNSVRLGADKTGVKRKYHEKMISNMGDVNEDGYVNAADTVAAKARGDIFGDHELETATGAGVRTLVLEGDAQNTALPSVVVNVAGGGSSMTAQQLSSAMTSSMMTNMDTDSAKAGLQMDIGQLDALMIAASGTTPASLRTTGPSGLSIADHTQAIKDAFGVASGADIRQSMDQHETTAAVLDAFGVPLHNNNPVMPGDNAAMHIGTAVEYPEGTILVDGIRMSYKVVKDHLMWEVGVIGNLLALAEVLMATGSFGLAVLNTLIGGAVTSDQLVAAHQLRDKDVTLVGVQQNLHVPVNITKVAGTTLGVDGVPIDSGDVQTGVQNALTVQDVRVINAPGTSLTTGVTGSVGVINAPNTTLATSGHPTHLTVGNAVDPSGAAIPLDTSGHPTSVSVSNHPVHPTHPTSTTITGTVTTTGSSGLAAGDAAAIAAAIEQKTLTTTQSANTGVVYYMNNVSGRFCMVIVAAGVTYTAQAALFEAAWIEYTPATKAKFRGATVIKLPVTDEWIVTQLASAEAQGLFGTVTRVVNQGGSDPWWQVVRFGQTVAEPTIYGNAPSGVFVGLNVVQDWNGSWIPSYQYD